MTDPRRKRSRPWNGSAPSKRLARPLVPPLRSLVQGSPERPSRKRRPNGRNARRWRTSPSPSPPSARRRSSSRLVLARRPNSKLRRAAENAIPTSAGNAWVNARFGHTTLSRCDGAIMTVQRAGGRANVGGGGSDESPVTDSGPPEPSACGNRGSNLDLRPSFRPACPGVFVRRRSETAATHDAGSGGRKLACAENR